jgi:hypothetical protein
MPNPIAYFEIAVSDLKRSMDFYSKLFDWKISAYDWKISAYDGEGYALINTGEGIGGGLNKIEGDMAPYVTVYAGVDDCAAFLDKAVGLGAFVIAPKTLISDKWGYYSMFADPDRNPIGLWTRE